MLDSKLRVLLIGKGGRESALAFKLSRSPRVESIFVVPGNGGTGMIDKVSNIDSVHEEDYSGLVLLANKLRINLVVPGPDVPIVSFRSMLWSIPESNQCKRKVF